MDYLNILKSKKHNEHYLNRYIKFIKHYKTHIHNNNEYCEVHHICPKATDMFPEFKDLKTHPWNAVNLPFRAHIIAHYMLMKVYNNISQTLSVIRTQGQYHNKIVYKSKLIEIAKNNLSTLRKGKFTRGYNSNGKPNVSQTTKDKISLQKIEYYKNPENRIKQSLACKGTTGRKSEKYSIAAKNRTPQHLKNLSDSAKRHYEALSSLERKRITKGVYITPFGNYTTLPNQYISYCKNNKTPFNIHHVKNNPLLNKSILGKTPYEIGFNFIPKNDPTISQYYDGLNQVRQPEPSHPLLSELNDYLSRQNSHP